MPLVDRSVFRGHGVPVDLAGFVDTSRSADTVDLTELARLTHRLARLMSWHARVLLEWTGPPTVAYRSDYINDVICA